ncbi:hypothetical protein L195_g014522 [Trifolium pratense]|uniref:Uncharacterized protein n=1 Tax=Trifolium pratense TaxID=57577 RepID=A0A2K3PR56_TRIPR|nr:hypothetical protein L195_g014522 [Trifolium pratense]
MAALKKILSALELEYKMEMGLCLVCDELFTVDHARKHKGTRFVVVETDEEEVEQVHDEKAHEVAGVSQLSFMGSNTSNPKVASVYQQQPTIVSSLSHTVQLPKEQYQLLPTHSVCLNNLDMEASTISGVLIPAGRYRYAFRHKILFSNL